MCKLSSSYTKNRLNQFQRSTYTELVLGLVRPFPYLCTSFPGTVRHWTSSLDSLIAPASYQPYGVFRGKNKCFTRDE
jgi:hypothetical protein